ncbi:MAG: 50S ribosomal protein L11 methyltransferase [Bacteroidota bacterium]
MIYLELDFRVEPVFPFSEILIAELGECGFESFVEQDSGVLAYILKSNWDANSLKDISILQSPDVTISWTQKEIQQENWNAAWERNFHPIQIDGRCVVRAPFHSALDAEYDIVIAPKMSFGTGHHQTTYMMLKWILELDLIAKSVLDMGCGTGVLAILAKMKGAQYVDAIDVDTWSYQNAKENCLRNGCGEIQVHQGDVQLILGKKYDAVLANINRNILLQDIPRYAQSLNTEGMLLLSGFYKEDLGSVSKACQEVGLQFIDNLEKNNWVAALYRFS